MKKILLPLFFCIAATTAYAQAERTDFALTSPDILPAPVVFPGGTVTLSSKFSVTGNDFVFSSGSNPQHASIKYTFTKCDPPAPTGNGAALFTWVKAITGLSPFTATYTGSTRDTTMFKTVPGDPSFHARYNIIFADAVVMDSSSQALKEIGFYGVFTDPTDAIVDQTPIDNQSGLSTNSVTPVITPVKWLSFGVVKQGKAAQLAWATASEQNSHYFEVERSADGASFVSIGRVEAQGNSTLTSNYSFTDKAPFSGSSYYRLQQVGLSSLKEYSATRQFVYNMGALIKMYPNPATDYIQLSGIPANALVQISGATGQQVLQQQNGTSLQKINVGALANGLYIIKVIHGGEVVYTATFVKK